MTSNRFLIKVVCDEASIGLLGVWETQGWAVLGREFEGVGVFNLRSSVEITLSGSNGRSPAPRKPPRMLFSVIALKNAVWRAGKKSSLVI